MTRRTVLLGGLALGACLLAVEFLEARPGGGQSYSRGSSGSSSRGSSSSGSSSSRSSGSSSRSGSSSSGSGYTADPSLANVEMPWQATLLIVVLIGGTMLIALAGIVTEKVKEWKDGYTNDWDSGAVRLRLSDGSTPAHPGRIPNGLEGLRAADPDFSSVLFEDFAYTLYAQAHRARHDARALAGLAPYLAEDVRAELARRAPAGVPVSAVIVGAMKVAGVWRLGNGHQVAVEYESNITVDTPRGPRAEYLAERWQLYRAADARTRPWPGARVLGCPNCGAPFEKSAESRCASCGEVAENGRFDWSVRSAEVLHSVAAPPALTGTVEEEGTDTLTVLQEGVRGRLAELIREDPSQSEPALGARLNVIFEELQAAWAAQDLSGVRPYVSDSLLHYLQYWVDAYKKQGLRNVVGGARITRSEVAKVTRDAHFAAVTVRIWGTGRDATTEAATGKVVGGDPDRDRAYSEYWTLIRGAAVRGAARTDKACPACGAPLQINMGGGCGHCAAHVTSGEFDWVLSKIEQDDSY